MLKKTVAVRFVMFDSSQLQLSVERRSPARRVSRVVRSLGCCRPLHRGIGPAFTPDMEISLMAAKKKTAKKAAKKTAKKAKKK